MCLENIIARYKDDNDDVGYGYVVVNRLYTPYQEDCKYMSYYFRCVYEKDVEYEAGVQMEETMDGKEYRAGFHIWTKLNNARKYLGGKRGTIVRVKYRGKIVEGEQCVTYGDTVVDGGCVVAKYRTILKEVEV